MNVFAATPLTTAARGPSSRTAAPAPLKLSLAQYHAIRADRRHSVDEGSDIRTVAQFFYNDEHKANELAHHLAHDASAANKLRRVPRTAPARERLIAEIARWQASSPARIQERRAALRGAQLSWVTLPDATGTSRIVGVLVKSSRHVPELFGYFPHAGAMRLQYHGAAHP